MSHSAIDFETAQRRAMPVDRGAIVALIRAAAYSAAALFAAVSARSKVNPEVREAAAVRALAQRYQASDRGFASDLLAAADRHEEAARASRPGSAADRR
jgi:hypothetical protein